jgi:hypothetical protein
MRELNKIADDLFNKIRSRFENVSLGDEKAKPTFDPEKARFFNFNYVDSRGTSHGNITISLVDEKSLKIYFTQDIASELESIDSNSLPSDLDQWYSFLRNIRQFAKRNMLTFDTRDITRNNLQVRDIKIASKIDSTYKPNEIAVRETKRYSMNNKYIVEFEDWANQVHEGTWATPERDVDKDELRKLMELPIEVGNDGTNAIGLLQDIIGSDSLFDEFKELSQSVTGAASDVRPLVIEWLKEHGYAELANEFSQINNTQPTTTTDTTTANIAAPTGQTTQSATESVNAILKLAGLTTLRRI